MRSVLRLESNKKFISLQSLFTTFELDEKNCNVIFRAIFESLLPSLRIFCAYKTITSFHETSKGGIMSEDQNWRIFTSPNLQDKYSKTLS